LSVCLSVCLFVRKVLLGNFTNIHILYMVSIGIHRGRFLSYLHLRPPNRPDAICRKPASGRGKWSKIDVFCSFSRKLWRLYL